MSKIVIMINTVSKSNLAQFTLAVRRATGLSHTAIASSVGKDAPLFEALLFMNDHEEIAKRLRDLMDIERKAEGSFRIYELDLAESFAACSRERCEINSEILRNMLDEHQRRRESHDVK